MNIRLSSGDLQDIQVKALEEGLPYQTLIASVLHKYVTGRLAECEGHTKGAAAVARKAPVRRASKADLSGRRQSSSRNCPRISPPGNLFECTLA